MTPEEFKNTVHHRAYSRAYYSVTQRLDPQKTVREFVVRTTEIYWRVFRRLLKIEGRR